MSKDPCLFALDVETTGLDFHTDSITVIGVWSPTEAHTFRTTTEFNTWLRPEYSFVGHNYIFDHKFLVAAGSKLRWGQWLADTQIMAHVHQTKIPEQWLERYEERRRILNKDRPKGKGHRQAAGLSLKTLAPYFLGVEPFWEPVDHNDDRYVLTDCAHTYNLYSYLAKRMTKEEATFLPKVMEWYGLLYEMESLGVAIDNKELDKKATEAKVQAEILAKQLLTEWSPAVIEWNLAQTRDLAQEYKSKALVAINKLKAPTEEKKEKLHARYRDLAAKAMLKIKPFNFDSPSQLLWALKEHYKLPVERLDTGEESTGKSVLEQLAMKGHSHVQTLLDYRKQSKLVTAFFPSYKEMQYLGRIYPSFRITGTRTGRLSSAEPNLQQVPGDLHGLFYAGEGRKLICLDQSAIEARLIAYYTDEVNLFDIVNNGGDIHGTNAKIFFGLDCEPTDVKELYAFERKVAKTVGFALFYGAGKNRLQFTAMQYGLNWSERECQYKVDQFREYYRQAFDFKNKTLDPLLMKGKTIVNLLGRPISFADPEDVYMQGLNTLVQSSASDLVVAAATKAQKLYKEQELNARVVLLVHDEIVVDTTEADAQAAFKILKDAMEAPILTNSLGRVKLVAEGGIHDRWAK